MKKTRAPKKVTKVKAYPLDGTLEINGVKKPLQIMLLNQQGLVAKVDQALVYVGERYQIQIQLPVSRFPVVSKVRVIKTYDKAVDPKVKTIDRMAEFHFEEIPKEYMNRITAFLSEIGQEK